MKSTVKNKIVCTAVVSAFLLSSTILPVKISAARERDSSRRDQPRRELRRLPREYREVRIGRERYYHYNHHFYRRGPGGFILVNPPFGSVVLSLPVGAAAFLIGGLIYYAYEGIYYRRVNSGYMVVENPPTQSAKEISPVVPSSQVVGETVSVNAKLLNVRSGPGLDFPVIFQAVEGETFVVHGYAPGWLYVKSQANRFGWIMVKYTTQESDAKG